MEKVERRLKTLFHRKSRSAGSNSPQSPRHSYEPQSSQSTSPQPQQHAPQLSQSYKRQYREPPPLVDTDSTQSSSPASPRSRQHAPQSPTRPYQAQSMNGDTDSSQASPEYHRHGRNQSLPSRSESSNIPRKTGRTGSISSPRTNTIDEHAPLHDFPSSPPTSGDEENTIAEDYRAYNAFVNNSISSKDSQYMSLGGDTRLVQPSLKRHNEDVATRNINKHSTPSSNAGSRQGSLETNKAGSVAAFGRTYSQSSAFESPGIMNSDRIFPHIEDPNAAPHAYNKADWPPRMARDEPHQAKRRQRKLSNAEDSLSVAGIREESRSSDRGQAFRDFLDKGPPNQDGSADVSEELARKQLVQQKLKGVLDLNDSEDATLHTRVAPAVVHETIKPTEHEIVQEVIYREIHNHEIYHLIQPVYETEILPARHYIPNPENPSQLIEVPESALPNCTGANQRWQITPTPLPSHSNSKRQRDVGRGAARERMIDGQSRSFPAFASAGLKEPRIIDEKRYMTPEGFERIETTWLHPPTLENMDGYTGPVMPIQFVHHDPEQRKPLQSPIRSEKRSARQREGALGETFTGDMGRGEIIRKDRKEEVSSLPEVPPVTLEDVTKSLETLDLHEKGHLPEGYVGVVAREKGVAV